MTDLRQAVKNAGFVLLLSACCAPWISCRDAPPSKDSAQPVANAQLEQRYQAFVIEANKPPEWTMGPHYPPLHQAASAGELYFVKCLLRDGAKINQLGGLNQTALNVAIEDNRTELAKWLIDNGADVQLSDPLGAAILRENRPVLELLEKRGAKPTTATLFAAATVSEEWARYCVERGVNPDAKNTKGELAIFHALEKGRGQAARYLARVTDPLIAAGKSSDTALHVAARHGARETATILIDRGAKLEAQNRGRQTPLDIAVRAERLPTLKALIERGAVVQTGHLHYVRKGDRPYQMTSLMFAVFSKNKELVAMLLEGGYDVNELNAFQKAAISASEDSAITELLLAHGANVDLPKELQGRVREQDKDRLYIRQRLQSGENLNRARGYQRNPLHLACQRAFKDELEALIEKGADVNGVDAGGNTPLHALMRISLSMNVRASFLRPPADAGGLMQEEQGQRIVAAIKAEQGESVARRIQIADRLLSLGAEINAKNPRDGNTPLHYACRLLDPRLAEHLLDRGADPGLANKRGETPLDMAKIRAFKELIKKMEQRNAPRSLKADDPSL